ncbi:MAG TPA: hypothetical protein PLM59_01240 [Oscillospiraceae bacterium]|nr:hypothetical protein [Oscillospiraceae bacterium]
MKKIMVSIICWMLVLITCVSCSDIPDSVEQDGFVVADENTVTSNAQDKKSEQKISSEEIFIENQTKIKQSSNKIIEDTIATNKNKKLIINAKVNVDGIKTVGAYQYLTEPISDNFRTSLFSSYFGDKASKMELDAKNNVWTLTNSDAVGDYYLYNVYYPKSGETVSGEESFSIEYRKVDLYPFDDNLLTSSNDSKAKLSAKEAVGLCDEIIKNIAELKDYKVDYIHAYGNNGRRPYYKIAYKRLLDGIPVTGYNDIYFLVDDNGIQKIYGSIFKVGEFTSQHAIMDIDEALNVMKKNAAQIFLDNDEVYIGAITLEYIVTASIDGSASITPAWRFQIGNTEDELNFHRDDIIAIDALNGDIIQGKRGDTF